MQEMLPRSRPPNRQRSPSVCGSLRAVFVDGQEQSAGPHLRNHRCRRELGGRVARGTGLAGGGAMKLFRQWRAVACAVGASAMLLGLAVAPAHAKPLEHIHFHDVGSEFPDECEGITLRHDFDVKGSFLLNQRGPDGQIYGRDNFRGTESWTNVDNDLAVTRVFNGSGHDLKVTDHGNGTLTILAQSNFNGKFYCPDGAFLFQDTGRVRFELDDRHQGNAGRRRRRRDSSSSRTAAAQIPRAATSAPTCSSSSAKEALQGFFTDPAVRPSPRTRLGRVTCRRRRPR